MIQQSDRHNPLAQELAWFIRLRWIAGSAVALIGAVEFLLLSWHTAPVREICLGLLVLLYNAALWWYLNRGARAGRAHLLRLAIAQMLLDLVCLAAITAWTDGLHSPILGFFVFHMVFASLLLPRKLAYASAVAAIVFLGVALAISGQFPLAHSEMLLLAGFVLTLLMTVALTNHITRDLHRQRRRLTRQNQRILAMSRQLSQNERAMIQQEKIVALGQMAAGISHEVMNPLANMDSLLQLAMHRPERMNADNILKLREQIARVNAIIHQMRSLVHPDEGQLQLVQLNDAVAKSIDMVGIDARARRVGIGRELGDDVGSAMVRQQSLQQVLVNLMLNSLDALADIQEPKLLVRTARIGNRYTIEVIDNGTGIKAEHLNRVFEPFFTTKPVGKGTGLGLSISHNLIGRMGGTIQASSAPGAGTTMTIELPAADLSPQPTATPSATKLESVRH